MEAVTTPQPVCAKEALDLLNCVAESPYDREKCVKLLEAVRNCVLQKKVMKFSLGETSHDASVPPKKE